MKRIVLALTVALLAAGPAAAQEHDGHPADMGMDHGNGHCMAMMAGIGAAMIPLHHPEQLELTAEQVQQLESLMTRAHEAAHPHMQMAMETGARAKELLDARHPDFAAYEDRLGEAAGHMVKAHAALARATVEARDLLTPEQQARLSEMDHEMTGMACMMKHGDAGEGAGAAHDHH